MSVATRAEAASTCRANLRPTILTHWRMAPSCARGRHYPTARSFVRGTDPTAGRGTAPATARPGRTPALGTTVPAVTRDAVTGIAGSRRATATGVVGATPTRHETVVVVAGKAEQRATSVPVRPTALQIRSVRGIVRPKTHSNCAQRPSNGSHTPPSQRNQHREPIRERGRVSAQTAGKSQVARPRGPGGIMCCVLSANSPIHALSGGTDRRG